MKYTKNAFFTTEEFSIDETISEIQDVIDIATITIKNISDGSENTEKEINMAIKNLDQAKDYLSYVQRKTDIALKYVPDDVKEKNHL